MFFLFLFMGLFGFGKRDNIIDLAEKYRKQKEIEEATKSEDFSDDTKADEITNNALTPEERRKKLAKRLIDITNKLDNLDNQIYHLQQRIELIEKKLNMKAE